MNFFNRIEDTWITHRPARSRFPLAHRQKSVAASFCPRAVARAAVLEVIG